MTSATHLVAGSFSHVRLLALMRLSARANCWYAYSVHMHRTSLGSLNCWRAGGVVERSCRNPLSRSKAGYGQEHRKTCLGIRGTPFVDSGLLCEPAVFSPR